MTNGLNWQEIDVPRGAYIGWGLRAGQSVTGVVLEFTPNGGSDFNQNPCPNLTLELIEEAWSANKAQEWTQIAKGEMVQLNCGQVSLKRAVLAADLSPGDLVKITLETILAGQGKNGGDVKEFGIKKVPGFRPAARPAPQAQPSQPQFGGPQGQPQPQFAQQGAPQPQFGGPQGQPQPQYAAAQAPSAQPQGDPWGGQAPQGQFAPTAPASPPFGTVATDEPPF